MGSIMGSQKIMGVTLVICSKAVDVYVSTSFAAY